ncbi:heparinase II/III-family protein [Desulforhabdus sp. TSK]|uniref:heparinase II/III family protein n=1 Tax=Desulforhabdus sp. TSK TaxID=2925014 RepID=UPI0027963200|nr:heparinase II/III-family protein [Desulforhabdus sp. TSK]
MLCPGCSKAWDSRRDGSAGGIVLFNDAAVGIAATTEKLSEYAAKLGIRTDSSPALPLLHFVETGYIRVERGPFTAFLDVAPVGPDYLPGHAHADTLTFELSVRGQRVIVDSGTSCYGTGTERQRQRSTAAHNTVEIDGESSSEVWSGFRVARRAYPRELEMREEDGEIVVACSHDAYRRLPGKPMHRREWRFQGEEIVITDCVQGRFSEAVSRFHFHPEVRVEFTDSAEGRLWLTEAEALRWRVQGGAAAVVPSSYHPHFGVSVPCQCLEIRFQNNHPQITHISAD